MTYTERTDAFIYSLGLDACRVGGSVRDELLGRTPKDSDYVIFGVSLAELRKALADAGRDIEKFDVSALVLRDGQQGGWRVSGRGLGCIEIMLPRKEISTGPGHGDFKIALDPLLGLADDAHRRDFTFNALYVPVSDLNTFELPVRQRVSDPTGRGLEDLSRRRINVTHADSFRDDPLRALRALRFVSTLGYELGAETRVLMEIHADAVTGLSHAGFASGTVLRELERLLMGQHPAEALRLARDTGVLARVLPELAPMLGFDQGSRYHDMTTDEHTFTALETAAHVDAPLRVRLALLFHDSGKPVSAWVGKDGRKHYYEPSDKDWNEVVLRDVEEHGFGGDAWPKKPADHQDTGADIWLDAAERLGVGREVRNYVETLIANHMVPCQKFKRTKVVRERIRLGDETLRDLYLMRMCDLTGKGKPNQAFLGVVQQMEAARADAERDKIPVSVRDLKINGHDVKALGVEGQHIGKTLAAVLDAVALNPANTDDREWQLARAAKEA